MQKVVLIDDREEIAFESGKLALLLREGYRIVSVDDCPRLRSTVFVLDEPVNAPRGNKEDVIAAALAEHKAQMAAPPVPQIDDPAPPDRDPNAPPPYMPLALSDE